MWFFPFNKQLTNKGISERRNYRMGNTKEHGSQYWLGKMIDNDSLIDKLEEIPGVKIINGSSVPSKGKRSEQFLETFLVDKKIICDEHPFRSWWVSHPGKSPTYDFICLAEIRGEKGIILLEAKAHKRETNKKGKELPVRGKRKDYDQACRNHKQIELNIKNEFMRLGKRYQGGYYQIANRIAYASKAHAVLNMPVLLVFFGFIGDCHFSDCWKNEPSWQEDINSYLKALDLPLAMNGEMTEIARGGPYVTIVSKRCAEIPQ